MIVGIAVLASVAALVRLEPDVPPHNLDTSSWHPVNRAPGAAVLSLTVALSLPVSGREALEAKFYAVSDPSHAEYGHHLSKDAITSLLNVPQAQVDRVRSFFLAAGALEAVASPFGDVITLRISVAAAEAALHTILHEYAHKEQHSERIIRASAPYSVPASIASDVTLVGELVQFPALRRRDLTSDLHDDATGSPVGKGSWPNACETAPKCKGLVTPAVLAQRYRLPNVNSSATAAAGNGSTMAVAEFQGQRFVTADLEGFSKACHANVKVAKVIGGDSPPSPGVESELDIEYIRAVAPDVPLTVVYAQKYSLLDWGNTVTALDAPPLVHSVSYGNDEKQQSGGAYMDAVNTQFIKAGARGLSILFASGDQGVCGREGCGFFKKRFKPDFPGGSPYHTSVGGTDFLTNDVGEEKVWSDGGGGFSDHFPIPSYQAAAVAAFKTTSQAAGTLPAQSLWNNNGTRLPRRCRARWPEGAILR